MKGGHNSLLVVALALIVESCGSTNATDLRGIGGPVVRVQATSLLSENPVVRSKGESFGLVMRTYDANDDADTGTGVTWRTRDAAIAAVATDKVIVLGAGTVYIIGELTMDGKTFVDSLRVTVLP